MPLTALATFRTFVGAIRVYFATALASIVRSVYFFIPFKRVFFTPACP
jgi:hypothetical protein